MASRPPVPPITNQFPIVTGEGRPTDYFIRWLQQRGFEIDGILTPLQVLQIVEEWSAARFVNTDLPLVGGGALSADLTLDHGPSGVTPGVYGDATNVPQFFVDADGHVTGVMEVPISGGGGGGGSKYIGYADIEAGVDRVVAAGYWFGKFIVAPRDAQITGMVGFFRAATAGVQMTPAIYSSTTTGTINTLLGSGATVTGVVPGLNVFPLSAPLSVNKGDLLYIGAICRSANPTMASASEKAAAFFAAASNVPVLGPPAGVTYGNQANWVGFWAETN